MTRIAEVLLNLQRAGNVTYYSGWKVSFDCATYTDIVSWEEEEVQFQVESADQRMKVLQAYAKKMEEDLDLWEKEVKKSRSHYYELNYYTMLQLLKLRKELGLVRQNPTKLVDPQILALLESISPKVTSSTVQNVISSLEKELLDLPLLVPVENTPVERTDIAITENLSDAPLKNTELHTATPTAVEIQPSPHLSPVTSDKPELSENDLTDSQKKIFTDLVEYLQYSKLLVLKAFEQLPPNSNHYDIRVWCDEYESMCSFEDEEEKVITLSSDEYSSDSGSDDEEGMYVFNQQSISGWHNYE